MLLKLNVYPRFAISRQLSNYCLNCRHKLYKLVLSADNLCKQFRPRSDPTGMIWIQTAWHSTDITERNIRKNNNRKTDFEKEISSDDKTMANYLVGKKSQWIEMEGATCTCRFHA